MKEVDMYKPLKKLLKAKGYTVHSEVESLDVMAQKGDELLIVEMKTSFNLQLIYQLIERLKITDQVYAYVPLGKGGRWPKSYKRMCALLKRLHPRSSRPSPRWLPTLKSTTTMLIRTT